MCKWFKKIFGCKCHGENCGSCCQTEENKAAMPENKPEAGQAENVEKPQ